MDEHGSNQNPKKKHSKDGQEEDEEDVEEVVERMTKEDAWMFPIVRLHNVAAARAETLKNVRLDPWSYSVFILS